jgi:hypothetical protein
MNTALQRIVSQSPEIKAGVQSACGLNKPGIEWILLRH